MACEYSFDGGKTFISKEEFVKQLAEGKLDEFINEGVIKLANIKEPPPPKTPTTQKEGEEGDGEERRFTKQMLGTESLLPKEKIAETLKYVKQTNALSIEEANKIIDEIGLDEAFALIVSDSEMNGGVRGVLGQMLISRYNNLSQTAKTQKEKEYYWDKTLS